METAELAGLNQEKLAGELKKAQEELQNLYDECDFFLGQTGTHISVQELTRFRRQFERGERRLQERISSIRALLKAWATRCP